jgi:actin-like ATPase involved in cell morphogenesis
MKMCVVARLLIAALFSAAVLLAQAVLPQIRTVDPGSVKAGDIVSLGGENLDQQFVSAVILTDGSADFKVAITEQTATSIKIKVPATLKPGRFGVVVRLKKDATKEIEEPVKVNVEE